MAIILQIDTASATAAVAISNNGQVLAAVENQQMQEHASFLQPAVQKMLSENGLTMQSLDAIAVVNGPGSYTGLRVGLASAKGLAYALDLPLISIGTLPLMAHAAFAKEQNTVILYAPMMDARRMEVFTAVYDCEGNEKISPVAMLLDNDSYAALLLQYRLLFFGSGAAKWKQVCMHENALFANDYDTIQSLAQLSFKAFETQQFAELAYTEPLYLKEFYTGQ